MGPDTVPPTAEESAQALTACIGHSQTHKARVKGSLMPWFLNYKLMIIQSKKGYKE